MNFRQDSDLFEQKRRVWTQAWLLVLALNVFLHIEAVEQFFEVQAKRSVAQSINDLSCSTESRISKHDPSAPCSFQSFFCQLLIGPQNPVQQTLLFVAGLLPIPGYTTEPSINPTPDAKAPTLLQCLNSRAPPVPQA